MSDVASAVVETPAPVKPVDGLRDLSETQRSTWLKTGELPKAEPQTDSAAESVAKPEATDTAADVAAESQSPNEPATDGKPAKVAKPRNDINARLGQLTEQRNTERTAREAAERERDELRAKLSGGVPATDPKSVHPPSTAKAPSYLELTQRYKALPDYPKLEDYVAAIPDPTEAYDAYEAAKAIFVQDQRQADIQQAAQQQSGRDHVNRQITKAWDDARTIPDFNEAALATLVVPPHVQEAIFEHPLSGKLLHYFSNHTAEARAVAAMGPLPAALALGELVAQLKSSPVVPSTPAAKTVSSAPEPPITLGSRHTPGPIDEVEAAVRAGDTGRYIEAANQRDLAALKSGRR